MAQKTVKKAAAKPAAKKTSVKKTVAKNAPAKKINVKSAQAAENMHASHDCGCGCSGRAGRFLKKLLLVVIIFALGFATARLCCGGCQKGKMHRAPRMHFVQGCLDTASVKCPKLAAALPAMDINQDGCITRDEFRAVKRQMRAEVREIPVEEVIEAESVTVAE